MCGVPSLWKGLRDRVEFENVEDLRLSKADGFEVSDTVPDQATPGR